MHGQRAEPIASSLDRLRMRWHVGCSSFGVAVQPRPEPAERTELLEERAVPAAATGPPTPANVNADAAVSPVWTVTRVVTLLFTVLEVLLLLRFILKLLGANPDQPLVAGLYAATDTLVAPFQGIFPQPAGLPVLDVPATLAIVFLFMVAALIVALVRAIAGRSVAV